MCNVTNHIHHGSSKSHHPMLASNTTADGHGRVQYHSSMQLPAHDDARGILRFLGLTDEMIELMIMDRLGVRARTGAGSGAGSGSGAVINFEAVDELLSQYLSRPADTAHGLIPELAASCGRIEISSYFKVQMAPGTTQFFSDRISPDRNTVRQDADRIVKKNATLLKDLWLQRQASEVNMSERP